MVDVAKRADVDLALAFVLSGHLLFTSDCAFLLRQQHSL
jgi:hypothetical protein